MLPLFQGFVVSCTFVLLMLHIDTYSRFGDYFSAPNRPSSHYEPTGYFDEKGTTTEIELPPEYTSLAQESSFCAERFGLLYLEGLRDSATEYCTAESSSTLTCFHSQTHHSRIDSFCIGRSASFDSNKKKFHLDCGLADLSRSQSFADVPSLDNFQSYWYETGPGVIFNNSVQLDANGNGHTQPSTSNFSIIIKREGPGNPWHSLLEIFSMTMTIDVLRMSRQKNTKSPAFSLSDVENTQVVIADNAEDGPYFDLWKLFAKRPPLRISELSPDALKSENIIVPLPGGSNPIWQGDWDVHDCQRSDLLSTFSRRVLDFYKTEPRQSQSDRDINSVVVTYVNRTGTRKLLYHDRYLEKVRKLLPHVTVQSVDFENLSFPEQIQVAQYTDVLVGVHGAGLTHGMFLPENSVMIEILPPGLAHKGFRNLAGLLGHSYFSVHGAELVHGKRDEWHDKDVFLEEERFLDLMSAGVKVLYNEGSRNFDVN